MQGHSFIGVFLNGALEGIVPVENWNSVAEQETKFLKEDSEVVNLKQLFYPDTGRNTIITAVGEKSRLYPEAIKLAIDYQINQE